MLLNIENLQLINLINKFFNILKRKHKITDFLGFFENIKFQKLTFIKK